MITWTKHLSHAAIAAYRSASSTCDTVINRIFDDDEANELGHNQVPEQATQDLLLMQMTGGSSSSTASAQTTPEPGTPAIKEDAFTIISPLTATAPVIADESGPSAVTPTAKRKLEFLPRTNQQSIPSDNSFPATQAAASQTHAIPSDDTASFTPKHLNSLQNFQKPPMLTLHQRNRRCLCLPRSSLLHLLLQESPCVLQPSKPTFVATTGTFTMTENPLTSCLIITSALFVVLLK